MMVRISEIQIDPARLDEYKAILKEESEASVRLEPGVISIFPMYQRDDPTQIRILEIIGRLGPGAHELICHPGEEDDDFARRRELEALTSPLIREAVATRQIQLCRWQDLF